MQTVQVEHKKILKTTSNQKQVVGNTQPEELENKREGKGMDLATSRDIYRLLNSDVYYVQSERSDDIYYYVKYNPSVFEYCSCPDNSIRGQTCKHIFGIIHTIKKGTLQDIEKLPLGTQRYSQKITAKDWRNDEYDF